MGDPVADGTVSVHAVARVLAANRSQSAPPLGCASVTVTTDQVLATFSRQSGSTRSAVPASVRRRCGGGRGEVDEHVDATGSPPSPSSPRVPTRACACPASKNSVTSGTQDRGVHAPHTSTTRRPGRRWRPRQRVRGRDVLQAQLGPPGTRERDERTSGRSGRGHGGPGHQHRVQRRGPRVGDETLEGEPSRAGLVRALPRGWPARSRPPSHGPPAQDARRSPRPACSAAAISTAGFILASDRASTRSTGERPARTPRRVS